MNQRVSVISCLESVGREVTLYGWADSVRDHGKLTFVDLRDRTGLIQCVGYQKMSDVSTEDVLKITGTIKKRPEKLVNPAVSTGTIELDVSAYEILSEAKELPIPVTGDGYDLSEEVRLRYRYLDLRRERLRKIVTLRSNYVKALRDALHEDGFTEVETPILTKSTKEGARDFVVPSRFQPGKFYALPQSPQQYKQLLMTAGVERYFQFARCVRDEDLRADRGFEFTQLDMELSFVDETNVRAVTEKIVKHAVKAVGGKLRDETFPVIEYEEAMKKYGSDKFDMRSEDEKKEGVLAFAWVVRFPFFKKVDAKDVAEVRDGKSGWTFTHNPFSKPIKEHEQWLLEKKNIGKIIAAQYDLVCNGHEVGGGSIRAHNPLMLRATIEIMGYTPSEVEKSVGHMLEAFELGTPPHGGIALGIDRQIMLLTGESSLKEVIAFPMTSTGRTAVMDAPSEILPEQLKELGLSINAQPAKK